MSRITGLPWGTRKDFVLLPTWGILSFAQPLSTPLEAQINSKSGIPGRNAQLAGRKGDLGVRWPPGEIPIDYLCDNPVWQITQTGTPALEIRWHRGSALGRAPLGECSALTPVWGPQAGEQ